MILLLNLPSLLVIHSIYPPSKLVNYFCKVFFASAVGDTPKRRWGQGQTQMGTYTNAKSVRPHPTIYLINMASPKEKKR